MLIIPHLLTIQKDWQPLVLCKDIKVIKK